MKKTAGRKKQKKTPIVLGVIAVIVVILMLAGSDKSAETLPEVTTAAAFRGELQESITTSGMVEAEQVRNVTAPASGRIAQVKVADGDIVKKGEMLILYDEKRLESELHSATLQQNRAQSSYDSVAAGDAKNQARIREANVNLAVLERQISDTEQYLKNLQEELDKATRTASNALAQEGFQLNHRINALTEEIASLDMQEDAELLIKKNEELRKAQTALSQNTYQQQTAASTDQVKELQDRIAEAQETLAGYKEYKARMESQKEGSEAALTDSYLQAQYDIDKELSDLSYQEALAAYQRGKAGVSAEFDGVVTQLSVMEGMDVMEGGQMFTLESTDQMKVTFSVSKNDFEKLEEGQKAKILISGNSYTGVVSKISHKAQITSSGTPMVDAQVRIDHPDGKIVLGLDAKLTIYTRLEENAILIPVEAINGDREGDFVYVVENGVVVRRPVVCGISSDTYSVVLEGVSEGEQVVLFASGNLEEGMAVNAMPQ